MAKAAKKTVPGRVLHDPVKDKLRPIFPIDLSKCRTIDQLVRAMADTAFTGRQIGDAADVLEAMARDKDCFVVMTLSGALTVGKMGLIFCDLIESGIVKAIVSTGALMAHGLVEATGHSHFRYDPDKMDDEQLFEAGYNRVYDSLEPEVNLDHVEEVMDLILDKWDASEVACSWKIHRRIGEYLVKHSKGRGILKSAYEHNVPVFVPAFTDSELGIASFCATIRLRTSRNLPARCWPPSGWVFSLLGAACRVTGRNSSVSTPNFWRGAVTKNFRSSVTTTACAYVPNRCTGAASAAVPTRKPFLGGNLFPFTRVECSRRSSTMPPLHSRWWSVPSWNG